MSDVSDKLNELYKTAMELTLIVDEQMSWDLVDMVMDLADELDVDLEEED